MKSLTDFYVRIPGDSPVLWSRTEAGVCPNYDAKSIAALNFGIQVIKSVRATFGLPTLALTYRSCPSRLAFRAAV